METVAVVFLIAVLAVVIFATYGIYLLNVEDQQRQLAKKELRDLIDSHH